MTRSIGVGVLLAGALAGTLVLAAPVQNPPEKTLSTEYLYILEQAAERVRARLQALRRSPQADPEEIAEAQRYLQRLESQIAASRPASGSGKGARPGAMRTRPVVPRLGSAPRVVVLPEATESDEVAALDSKLNTSLGTFDEMLLQEVDLLKGSRRGVPDGSPDGGGTAGAGGTAGEGISGAESSASAESGEDHDGTTTSSSGPTGIGEEKRRTETGTGATVMKGGTTGRGAKGDTEAPGRKSKPPPDIPDGSDDDVVARQIREAAENETDPALREKLWDEYRMYKRGSG